MGLMSLIKLINIKGLFYYNRVYWLQSSKLLKCSLKSIVLNTGFKITGSIQIKNASKLLFALTSDYRKAILAFLYFFNLFKSPLIILINRNNFQRNDNKGFKTIININLEFI